MPTFEYEVVDRAGAIGRGRLQADDHNEAVQRFRKQGQLVVSLRATTDQASGSVADALRGSIAIATRRGVRLGTLVLFTGQLAAMLDAGIHLVRILTALGRELTDRRFARVIDDVQKSLTEGASFADALARYPRIFNTLYVAVVRAGEVSGTLPIVLDTLTVYLEKTAHLRRRVRGAIAYPAVILVTAVLIVVVMILNRHPCVLRRQNRDRTRRVGRLEAPRADLRNADPEGHHGPGLSHHGPAAPERPAADGRSRHRHPRCRQPRHRKGGGHDDAACPGWRHPR
ncbi:MAG: hypothetical protein E6I09_06540 [Chloroflexi bacterium]|nr:MAG: hypothetical protein E6I09_06540 [Chloroflexota bacterium]